jgi:hypothetical protein
MAELGPAGIRHRVIGAGVVIHSDHGLSSRRGFTDWA